MGCIVSAATAAAQAGYAAPQPAHLLVAVLQHPAAEALLPMLLQHKAGMEDVKTVLKMGLLLQQELGAADIHKGTLINPLHDEAPLSEATKAVLHASLRMASNEGSDTVQLHHLFTSLCDGIISPMAYALYQLLGEDTAKQAMAQLVWAGSIQLRAAVHSDDAVAASAPQHSRQIARFLARLVPTLQRQADIVELLASYDRMGVYPDVAMRQRLLQQGLGSAGGQQYSNKMRPRVQLKVLLRSRTAEDTNEIAHFLHVASSVHLQGADGLPWPQYLQLLRSLGWVTPQTVHVEHETALKCDTLWSCILSYAQQGAPVHELLDAARCVCVLKMATPARCLQLASTLCASKQYTDQDKTAAVHGLISAADMTGSANKDGRHEWLLKLLQSVGDAENLQLPTKVWEVLLPHLQQFQGELRQLQERAQKAQHKLTAEQDAWNVKRHERAFYSSSPARQAQIQLQHDQMQQQLQQEVTAAQEAVRQLQQALDVVTSAHLFQWLDTQSVVGPALLTSLLGVISENRDLDSPQLRYDAYSKMLAQLPRLSLTDAVQVLGAAQGIGSPPPSLVAPLVGAVASLMTNADVSASDGAHHYLTVLDHFSLFTKQAGQLARNQPGRKAGDSSTSSQPAADLLAVHQYLAVQSVHAFQSDIHAREPMTLQALGQQVAKGSVSAGMIARQLLQPVNVMQYNTKELLTFLHMAVLPASITNLDDMAACLVTMYRLSGKDETAQVSTWLNAAKRAVVRLLWQSTQQGWVNDDEPAIMACLSAWVLLRPADQMALGDIPRDLPVQTPGAAGLLWALSAVWSPDMSEPVQAVTDNGKMKDLFSRLGGASYYPGPEPVQLAAAACQLRSLSGTSSRNPLLEQLSAAAAEALFTHLHDDSDVSGSLTDLDAEELQMLSTLVLQLLPAATAPPAATADASAAEQLMTHALHVLLNEMEARMQDSDNVTGTSSSSADQQEQQGSSTAAADYRLPPVNKHQQWRAVMAAIKSRL